MSTALTSVALGQMNTYKVSLTLPPHSSSDYSLEVYMPFNSSAAQIELCTVFVSYSGVNNPCPALELFPVYGNRLNITGVANDYAIWNLGKITNSGVQSTSLDPQANLIEITIIAQVPLNHSDNVVGATPWITVGINYAPNKLWLGQQAITINSVDLSPTVSFNSYVLYNYLDNI